MLQPFRANQATMRQQPVVAEIDAKAAEHVEQPRIASTTPVQLKNHGSTRQQRDQMVSQPTVIA